MSTQKIYFISDVHLGFPVLPRPSRVQEDALISFLRSIRNDADILYIVGDLFDFWFEYRAAVPKAGACVLFELYALVQAGVRVVYLPGNHDIWLGPYLSEQVGLELPGAPLTALHQNLRLFIAHGDDFRDDWKFRASRALLKSPACIALFRLLHPDLGALLGRTVSRISEYRSSRRPDTGPYIFLPAARKKIAEGYQVVVCGHYHHALLQPLGAGTLVVLGDWVRQDTYAVLENGRIELKRWRSP